MVHKWGVCVGGGGVERGGGVGIRISDRVRVGGRSSSMVGRSMISINVVEGISLGLGISFGLTLGDMNGATGVGICVLSNSIVDRVGHSVVDGLGHSFGVLNNGHLVVIVDNGQSVEDRGSNGALVEARGCYGALVEARGSDSGALVEDRGSYGIVIDNGGGDVAMDKGCSNAVVDWAGDGVRNRRVVEDLGISLSIGLRLGLSFSGRSCVGGSGEQADLNNIVINKLYIQYR